MKRNNSGFTLVEVLVSTALGMALIGMLSTALLYEGRSVALMAKRADEEATARSQFAIVLSQSELVSSPNVTVTLDDSTPADAACRLYHLSTLTASGKEYSMLATRGCQTQ